MSEDESILFHPADVTAKNRLALLTVENELLCRHSASVMVLRLFDVYGPKCPSLVSTLLAQAKAQEVLSFPGTPEDKRTFLYIDDLLSLLDKLEQKLPSAGKMLLNVGATEAISNSRLCEVVYETVNGSKEGLTFQAKPVPTHLWKIPNIQRVQAYAKWTPIVSLNKGLFYLLHC